MFLLFNNFYNMTNEIDETFFIFGFEWFNNSCAHDSALFLLKGLYEDIDLDTRLQLMNFLICPILGEWLELTSWHDSAQFSIQRKDYLLAAYIDYIRNLQDHPHTKYMAYTDNYDCWHSPKVGAFACLFLMLHSCSTDMLKVGMQHNLTTGIITSVISAKDQTPSVPFCSCTTRARDRKSTLTTEPCSKMFNSIPVNILYSQIVRLQFDLKHAVILEILRNNCKICSKLKEERHGKCFRISAFPKLFLFEVVPHPPKDAKGSGWEDAWAQASIQEQILLDSDDGKIVRHHNYLHLQSCFPLRFRTLFIIHCLRYID